MFSFSLFFVFFVLLFLCFSFSFSLLQHKFETEVESISVICFKQRLFFVRPLFFGTPFEYFIESTIKFHNLGKALICETVGIKKKEKDLKSLMK